MKRCACGILIKDGRILLAKQSPNRELFPGVWDMVGGHQEAGETMDATLRREFEEEIGVTPTEFSALTVIDEPAPEINVKRAYHVYAINEWCGPGPAMRGDEHTEIRWFTPAEALTLDLALPQYRAVLKSI